MTKGLSQCNINNISQTKEDSILAFISLNDIINIVHYRLLKDYDIWLMFFYDWLNICFYDWVSTTYALWYARALIFPAKR